MGTCWLEVSAVLEGANLWVENSELLLQSMATELCQGRQCSGPHVPSIPVALCHLILFIHGLEIQCHSSFFFLSTYREVIAVFFTVQTLN